MKRFGCCLDGCAPNHAGVDFECRRWGIWRISQVCCINWPLLVLQILSTANHGKSLSSVSSVWDISRIILILLGPFLGPFLSLFAPPEPFHLSSPRNLHSTCGASASPPLGIWHCGTVALWHCTSVWQHLKSEVVEDSSPSSCLLAVAGVINDTIWSDSSRCNSCSKAQIQRAAGVSIKTSCVCVCGTSEKM